MKQEEIPKKKKKTVKKQKQKKLVMNVLNTKYHVVKYVGKKVFQMRLSTYNTDAMDEKHEWDLCWCDGGVTVDRVYKMKQF